MSSTRQLRPWIHLEIRPCLRAKCRALTHGTSNIYRLPTYIGPSTADNHHKHALHHQNSTCLCIASIYNTITNDIISTPYNQHQHHLSTASPSSTSISTTTRPFQQQICLPAPAQDIPTCFPRRDTIALFCLSTIPLASESPVSPFYDTQHLFTQQKAHYFFRLWLFFFSFCRFFCFGYRFH